MIILNTEPLYPVVEFPYLGRTVAYKNSNWVALYQNLQKVQWRWEIVGKVVTMIEATVRARGIMYKAIVQLVLLYRSES